MVFVGMVVRGLVLVRSLMMTLMLVRFRMLVDMRRRVKAWKELLMVLGRMFLGM